MQGRRRGRGRARLGATVAALVALGTMVAAVPAGAQSGSRQGVTPKEIQVGAVIAKTNPTGIDYDQFVEGFEAYAATVKPKDLYGRKLKIVKVIDDQVRSSKNLLAARSMIEEVKPFAVLHASQDFSGADTYVQAGMPVFGYIINTQWSKGPNLFGSYGSYLCLDTCPQYPTVYLAQQLGAKRVGVFAYGSSPSSSQCADVVRQGFEKWGPRVAVYDTSLAFGFSANDISGAVQAIKENQVDFVTTCMDLNGVVNLKKAIQGAGITGVTFYAPQGYDNENLEQLGEDLENFTFLTQFVPFEAAKGSPGMNQFFKALKARRQEPSENRLVGWLSAALLTRGIQDAGKDFTQKSVVDAINKITDWTGDGIVPPINWTTAHGPSQPGDIECVGFVAVEKGKFVPKYGSASGPMPCFPVNPYPAALTPVRYFGGT